MVHVHHPQLAVASKAFIGTLVWFVAHVLGVVEIAGGFLIDGVLEHYVAYDDDVTVNPE